jgi:hypothetical protein
LDDAALKPAGNPQITTEAETPATKQINKSTN